ncbi:MAG: hypothetical protein KAG99_00010 [Bacteroidales bacterium]|nr:hypothetical protein [Bacteroidales bacterium]
MIVKVLLLTILLVGFAFLAIAVKMFFKKNGQFEKGCSTIDPKTGKRLPCSCGSSEESDNHCDNKNTY